MGGKDDNKLGALTANKKSIGPLVPPDPFSMLVFPTHAMLAEISGLKSTGFFALWFWLGLASGDL